MEPTRFSDFHEPSAETGNMKVQESAVCLFRNQTSIFDVHHMNRIQNYMNGSAASHHN